MNIHDLHSVDEQYLKQLDGKGSAELFQDLLWVEVHRLGIPLTKVTISLRISVPDGGVDAVVDVDDISLPLGSSLEKGRNSFQLKTGETFKPQNLGVIKKELFGRKKPCIGNLASEVKHCLEENGRYVVVCFGLDLTPQEREKAKQNLRDYLGVCGFNTPNIDVWGINHLKSFIEQYPALALQTNRFFREPFWTHNNWANNADMKTAYIEGKEQKELLDGIRSQLRRKDFPAQLRILGEAGLGKTRLALEATNVDDIRPLVIYVLASDLDGSPVLTGLMRNDKLNAILIVDECDLDQRARFWNNLRSYYPRIKLITIYNEPDFTNYDITIYELPPLDNEQINAIIQSYDVTKFEADRWVPECGGSPRVAHVVGLNLRSNPDDILKSPSNINVWDRFICGGDKPDSDNALQRRTVLQHIALFKRFGYDSPLIDEAKFVQKLIQEANPNITWERFYEIVKALRGQHILQGKSTLYITPRLLHVRLWLDWWDLHGSGFDINRINEFPARLIEWFFEMFEYAAGSPPASQKVKELLDENGVFYEKRGEFLKTRNGGRFFFHLTLAEPVTALRCLQQTIGTWTKQELKGLFDTRSLIVSSLEYIALWKDLFQGAARLLLLLGEAENQSYSNNASGVFAGLFQLSEYKDLSKSEASPDKRLQILREAFNSKSPEGRRLGLEACKRALSWTSGGFIRDSHRIVGKQPNLWSPGIYKELFDAFREIWKLLLSSLNSFEGEDREIAIKTILESASNVARIPSLNKMVLEDLEILSEKDMSPTEKESLIAAVLNFTHYFRKEIDSIDWDRWAKFQKKLTGSNFHDLLVRYVAMDLIIDRFDAPDSIIEKIHDKIRELADYGISHQDELKQELPWLMSNDFIRAREFAAELGKLDSAKSLFFDITHVSKELKNKRTPAVFLGSYLQACFLQDKNEWMKLVQSFAKEDDLVYAVPMIIWNSHELSEDSAILLMDLAKAGKISLFEFQLFEYYDFFLSVSQNTIQEWFDLLLSQNDRAFTLIALSTHHNLYVYKHKERIMPEGLTLFLLTHPSLINPSDKLINDQMGEHYWTWVAGKFIEQFPAHALEISRFVLEHFADRNTYFGKFFSEAHNVVGRVAQVAPDEVWKQITKYLDSPHDDRSYELSQWLHGDSEIFGKENTSSPLDIFPAKAIWDWVDENVEKRARYLASFVPKALHRKKEKVCWARELLVRYGELESIRDNLLANFQSGSWSGPASMHYLQEQTNASEFKKDETNQQVIRWLDDYINRLEEIIQSERIREERDLY